MKLLIAIPALNEEGSIGSIIERCLAARESITRLSPVSSVEVTVVSDGSTDRTVPIAQGYGDRIKLIIFEKNRGYGAAIAEAWRQSDADLLSFLDADGTCDPLFLARACREIVDRDVDVVVGCRLNKESRMPLTRRLGNILFAWTLSLISLHRVRDTASGLRVVRRSSLPELLPLPTGMHFTPAMTARAILCRDLELLEIDMPYHERQGASKLRPIRDGLRFLRVILETAFLYRPLRLLGLAATALLVAVLILMYLPISLYLSERHLDEWMIYRILVSALFASMSTLLYCIGYLGQKAADISLSRTPHQDRYRGIGGWLFSRRWFFAIPSLLVVIGVACVWDAFLKLLSTGTVTEHWSRFVATLVLLIVATILSVSKVVDYTLNLLADRLAWLRSHVPEHQSRKKPFAPRQGVGGASVD